ncbi:hypothetical protein ACFP1Z_07610 [Streptomyces gamaensis]|uniref:Serine/threonine protein kinase n=1 Tax=Streptomyces gamaensis TaxID=1763542 RepID=A0ABW0YYY1_9ACTN
MTGTLAGASRPRNRRECARCGGPALPEPPPVPRPYLPDRVGQAVRRALEQGPGAAPAVTLELRRALITLLPYAALHRDSLDPARDASWEYVDATVSRAAAWQYPTVLPVTPLAALVAELLRYAEQVPRHIAPPSVLTWCWPEPEARIAQAPAPQPVLAAPVGAP